MTEIPLSAFIGDNREQLIHRCRVKVAARPAPLPTEAESDHGVPMFLDQLILELHHGPSMTHTIATSALQHGSELLRQGMTISQVVHDYGDVCQSISDLALECDAPISTEDFRTLNRCLDDAIAGAVTEYSRGLLAGGGLSAEVRQLADTAIIAFEALETGKVGMGGATAAVVRHNLAAIRALALGPLATIAES